MNAKQLINERIERQWTQKRLADEAGLSQGTIAKIESGKMQPTYKLLYRLKKALGKDITIRISSTESKLIIK